MGDIQRMSDRGRSMLIELEGSRPRAYLDVAGFLTIGVGHMLTRSELTSGKIAIAESAVRWRDGLSDEQIGLLLAQDLGRFEHVVAESVKVDVSQERFDALVSFVFNTGAGAFKRSTLLRWVNAGRLSEVPEQMRRWIYAGGEMHDGLVARREVEIERWNERGAA